MYKISTLNKISQVGLDCFGEDYCICDSSAAETEAAGILVRSQDMHEMTFGKELLAIARAGAGVNNIPLDRCAENGIVVFNTPGANANSVKELIIGSMIIAVRNIAQAFAWTNDLIANHDGSDDIAKAVEKGKSKFAGNEIKGKTLGVVGLGAIGAMVAKSALDLGMNVCGYDPYLSVPAALRLDPKVKLINKLEELLPQSDVITLHLPALDSTKGMINSEMLSSFKDGAILLNFSRDKLVVEADILAALESGKLSKYVTDFATAGILGKANVVCTPHLGASTEEAEDNCAIMAAHEIMDYIERGEIVNSVNFPMVTLTDSSKHRVAIITNGIEDPVKCAASALEGITIKSIAGAVRNGHGYVLLGTDDEINPEAVTGEGIVRVRVIY